MLLNLSVFKNEITVRDRIITLALEIADMMSTEIQVVGVLTGAYIFVADLTRELQCLGVNTKVRFVQFDSKTQFGVDIDPAFIRNADVLLVDDILDTGRTMTILKQQLLNREPNQLWTCVMVDRPCGRNVSDGVEADFVGFTLEDDRWVVGYGLDDEDGSLRGLPFIGLKD